MFFDVRFCIVFVYRSLYEMCFLTTGQRKTIFVSSGLGGQHVDVTVVFVRFSEMRVFSQIRPP